MGTCSGFHIMFFSLAGCKLILTVSLDFAFSSYRHLLQLNILFAFQFRILVPPY